MACNVLQLHVNKALAQRNDCVMASGLRFPAHPRRVEVATVDVVTKKELLGHSNIGTIMRYAHSNDDAKQRAVERLNIPPVTKWRQSFREKARPRYNAVTATTTR